MNIERKKRALPRRGSAHSRPAASFGLRLRFVVGTIVVALVSTAGAFAYGQIQRQIDPATGITTYLYHPSPADRRIKAGPPPVSHRAQDKRPPRTVVSAKRKAETNPMPAEGITLSSYSDFPRVSTETQKARDMERRRILKHELAWEQAALDEAIANKDANDVLRRHRENIESLHREISNVQ